MKSLSHVWLFETPWTVAHQAPPSMELSRQEYWSGLPFPSPGDLPDPGSQGSDPGLPHCRQTLYHLSHQGIPIGIISRVTIYSLDLLLSQFGTVYCSSSNCCFLTCIQISQEEGKWYGISISWRIFQFVVIHSQWLWHHQYSRNRCFSCFFDDPTDLAVWSSVPLPFLNPAWIYGSSQFTYCWSLAWRILSITLLVWEMSSIVQ